MCNHAEFYKCLSGVCVCGGGGCGYDNSTGEIRASYVSISSELE